MTPLPHRYEVRLRRRERFPASSQVPGEDTEYTRDDLHHALDRNSRGGRRLEHMTLPVTSTATHSDDFSSRRARRWLFDTRLNVIICCWPISTRT